MSDYISRDKILAKQKTLHEMQYGTGSRTLVDVPAVRVSDIESIPAADVRPVVYGHMIGKEEAEKIFEETYSDYPFGSCSVCGHCDWDCVDSEGFNYCPNCVAKMGGTP